MISVISAIVFTIAMIGSIWFLTIAVTFMIMEHDKVNKLYRSGLWFYKREWLIAGVFCVIILVVFSTCMMLDFQTYVTKAGCVDKYEQAEGVFYRKVK